jgi:RNA polymerase sigma factor (sigma-70 family)
VQFANDRFSHWAADAQLRRNITQRLPQVGKDTAESSESFWVLYWHKRWQLQAEPLATGHLAAYLQEACYWAAQQSMQNLASSQFKLSDCFQSAISELPKVLKDYNASQGASLKTYANLRFRNAIRDRLRQQRETDCRSDWGLLRKLSQKRFVEVLQGAGLPIEMIDRYRLAWTCFKVYCAPTDAPATRQLAQPDRTTWIAIAKLYNAQCQKLAPAPEVKPEELERWLKFCAKQARNALYPTTTSLNLESTSGSGELQDTLTDADENSPIANLILAEELQEQHDRRTQVSEALTTALQQLNPQIQTLLRLYYGKKLTQQQIAAELETKQYTISRRLSSTKETLLLALARWSQELLHISLTSTAVKDMSIVLEEWLQTHYGSR